MHTVGYIRLLGRVDRLPRRVGRTLWSVGRVPWRAECMGCSVGPVFAPF